MKFIAAKLLIAAEITAKTTRLLRIFLEKMEICAG